MKVSDPTTNSGNRSQSVHQLNMYALAASAAGVGMLALSRPAKAEIVYTPTDVKIQGQMQLDLDGNGTVDFVLWHSDTCNGSTCASFLLAYPNFNVNNGFLATAHGHFKSAVALQRGATIKRGEIFNENIGPMAEHIKKECGSGCSGTSWKGQWANDGKGLANAYLGLKFLINGQFHFGWARITVKTGTGFGFTARLTGYAYETNPGQGIIAGRTHSNDEPETPAPVSLRTPTKEQPTLGVLATGAPGLFIWRRDE
jgi:hypothetical protein